MIAGKRTRRAGDSSEAVPLLGVGRQIQKCLRKIGKGSYLLGAAAGAAGATGTTGAA